MADPSWVDGVIVTHDGATAVSVDPTEKKVVDFIGCPHSSSSIDGDAN